MRCKEWALHRQIWLSVQLAFLAVIYVGLLSPASAQDKEDLFNALKSASTEREAKVIEAQIWEMWIGSAPSTEIETLVRTAMDRRRFGDYEKAVSLLQSAISQAPDYAEARNQMAFVLYLQGRKDKSLEAIEEVLALEPRHFGALSGKVRILMEQGRVRIAQKVLRDALAIHPFLPERFLLIEPDKPDEVEL
ncbi:tetratricopeptide repeat protein [Roseibium hamelinense]|uniref:Tetratricopeptide repeat protein n=1 Tax=Roseibium hamelinense TaxID=150831 RepID=A0A562T994_9HYPH|nr:tetratricopeptide repeat protein [Roseibium hamelinense]TWI90217.1 tetratricopeptide repeat protein [Roseibium hamelinense]